MQITVGQEVTGKECKLDVDTILGVCNPPEVRKDRVVWVLMQAAGPHL